jgi:hypothetical protein
MLRTPGEVRLNQETLEKFEEYIGDAEAAMAQTLRNGPFLWFDTNPPKAQQIRRGEILAELWSGRGPIRIPSGLIHDWIGGAWIPGTTLKETLALIQNYDNHLHIYEPEVVASQLLSRRGNDFKIFLRLLKKRIVTVVLDTEHDVQYRPAGPARWTCNSFTTRIAEVEDAGKSNEKIREPDTGYGFLWRLNSYWRFQERDSGVDVECRAISLTRDVPLGLGWIIEPIIQELPKESLIRTLECTRRALHAEAKQKMIP